MLITGMGCVQHCQEQKQTAQPWRVSGGLCAFAHEPAKQKYAGENQNKPNLRKKEPMQTKQSVMKSTSDRHSRLWLAVDAPCGERDCSGTSQNDIPPAVFQAAGPTAASIQSPVDAFRARLGDPNNLNNPGPLGLKGRREINWDGGNPAILDTTAPVNPFLVFLNTRGSQFKTPGLGLSQAPPSGGPQGGLAVLFGNPTYGQIFRAFSRSRLFTPVGSNITDASFSIPGTNGLSRQQSEVSARCSQMLISQMALDLA